MKGKNVRPMTDHYSTKYIVGQDNIRRWGMDIHRPVFLVTALLTLLFVTITLNSPEPATKVFEGAKNWSIVYGDALFIISGNFFILFSLFIALSPLGRIRLGGTSARPDFSTCSWFSMLFAAGMGIGLMFWSVAEPVAYYTNWHGTPLGVIEKTPEAMKVALGATIFHWCLHPWAIYGVVGLSLAFFAYNKGLPLTIRSGFYPLIKDRCWGWFGHVVDVIAVLATIFGLATSLGFGATQAASGLKFLFGFDSGIETQVTVIAAVTAVAIISVVRGLDGGVKILSNINMCLAATLLLFVFIAGPTAAILMSIATTVLSYAENIIPFSNWIGREDTKFFQGWTVFYWAWWISWSPFVGMFIARISKGRTVREFIIAVLIVPTLVTLVWMGTFGGTALEQILNGTGALKDGINDVSLAMFQMLQNLPYTEMASFLTIVLVLVFFVTSSDSGSLVVDSITAGGKLNAPVPQRIFWATMEGVIAAALLIGGGKDALGALQAAAITIGLPFTIVLLALCLGLYRGLRHERKFLQGTAAR